MGATVVMVCRNKEKGQAALAEIKKETGNDKIELLLADFSSLESVRQLAHDFRDKYSKLHVLINNAGSFNRRRTASKDGYEATLAINYLAPFLLTNLLLDHLKTSAPTRIINVSSFLHYGGHIDFDDLNMKKRYGYWKAYQQSKLALVLFTTELARRLQGTRVTANSVNPGRVATNLTSGILGRWNFVMSLPNLFIKSPKKGAETIVYLASSPEVEKISGEYWDNLKVKKSSEESYNENIAGRLWDVSEQLTHLKPLEVAN